MLTSIYNFIDKNFPRLEPNDTLSKSFSLFKDNNVIIVGADDEYQGVLVKKDIMKAKLPHDAKVKTFVRHVPKIKSNESLEEVARLMFESNIYHLPVVENDKIIGVIRSKHLLKKVREKYGDKPVKRYMTTPVITIAPDDSIGKAIKLFKEEDISRLPIVKNGKLCGILTMNDIISKIMHPEEKPEGWAGYGEFIAEKKEYLKLPVKGIMMESTKMMPPNTKIEDVIKQMLNRNFGSILLGDNRKLLGIVTKRDLLESLVSYGTKESLFGQFAGELESIKGFNKTAARNEIKGSFGKYVEFLKNAQVFVHLKQHDEKRRGIHLIYCKIRLSSSRGMFIASDEGWGFMQAIRNTVSNVERQIKKEKRR